MLFWKELILIRGQPRKYVIPQSHIRKFHWTHAGIGFNCVCSLWFLRPDCVRSLLYSSVPSRAFVMRSPLELIIMPLLGNGFSYLHSLPAARPGYPVPPVVKGWHSGDSLYYSIQWVESKDGTTWELIRGLGNSG